MSLVAASSLTFKGLRNQYRRDGLGAEPGGRVCRQRGKAGR